jgi:hypothetical protein
MPSATAVADPGLERIDFELGGRWFGCVDRVDPDLLIGVMRRAQAAPADQFDPNLAAWLEVVIGFIMAATDETEHDALVRAVTESAGADPAATAERVAHIFAGVLAAYADRQRDEVAAQIVANERARTATHPFPGAPPVRRRSTVADIERINRRHGRKATGEVIRPGG